MKKILPGLISLLILLIFAGVSYIYFFKPDHADLQKLIPKQVTKIQPSYLLVNDNQKLTLNSNYSEQEIKILINKYGKNSVELKVVNSEDDIPLVNLYGSRGVATYIQEANGALTLTYRVYGEYHPDKSILYFYPNPEYFAEQVKKNTSLRTVVSRMFLDFLANADSGYLLPPDRRAVPRVEPNLADIDLYVRGQKPLFYLTI